MTKFLTYLCVFPISIWVVDAININRIFKKNKVIQARILYVMLIFCLTYLVVNFIYDFLNITL